MAAADGMNQVTVLFFATLRDRAGSKSTTLQLPQGMLVKEFKHLLGQEIPSLAEHMHNALVAINHDYAFDEEPIPEGAEIALFPPVSGGSGVEVRTQPPTILAITADPLDLDALVAGITLPQTGAVCLFSGMVRAVTKREAPHNTEYLEYQAYQPMAEAKLRQVAEEIRARWPEVEGIVIVQRIGSLQPGTPTVLIGCSAAHRDTGVFEAARYGIDRLKQIVPVWKKEVSPDGEHWVEGEYHPGPGE